MGVSGFIKQIYDKSFVFPVVYQQATLINFIRVNSVLGGQHEVTIVLGNLQKRDLVLALDDTNPLGCLAPDNNSLNERDTEITAFDVWMVGLGI